MARFGKVVMLLFLLVLASFVSLSNARCRKLLARPTGETKKMILLEASLFLSALPKGTVRPSAPSKKGHAEVDGGKLFARHLITAGRTLRQSVPSPGVGH